MDSSSLQRASSVSSNRENEKKASAMIQSRRAVFFANYKRQNFSLPNSVMFYMAKNPTTPKVYQKMIESCKYFYVKNPILVIPVLAYRGEDKWEISVGKYQLSSRKFPCDLSKIASELWIDNRLIVDTANPNILSSLMPKLYRCDAKFVSVIDQIISFQDLLLLIPSAEEINFGGVTVKDKNGSNVGVEKIVEVAVKAKSIEIWSKTTFPNIKSETMKELIKLPHFSKLEYLHLENIPETFYLETFYGYMKKNKTTKFSLHFHDSISQAYKNRLEQIVDEILATKTRDYKPPVIDFAGLDEEKCEKLFDRFFSSPN